MATRRDNALTAIAYETLETRNSDALDFHEVGVAGLRESLARAYEAGRTAQPPTRCVCPACGREIEIRPV